MQNIKYKESSSNRDVISFFSGAMGLDIGLMKAELNIKLGQDFDRSCVATMRTNKHTVLEGDIRDIDPQTMLDRAGISQGEPFLICSG